MDLDGDMATFKSMDGAGITKKMRGSVDVPQELCLKVSAPVILVKNLSTKLVNGLLGYVETIHEDSVSVHFPAIKETCILRKEKFFQYDSLSDRIVFVTEQIPLILGFAITIHKSQGMTLDSVLLDCQGAFQAGQISVAMGRVRKKKNLTVRNFRPSLCPPHPPVVTSFYGQINVTIMEDKSCCRAGICDEEKHMTLEPRKINFGMEISTSEDEEHSESSDDEDASHGGRLGSHEVDISEECSFPTELDGDFLKSKCMFDTPYTKTQKDMNAILEIISRDNWRKFEKILWQEIWRLSEEKCGKKVSTKTINLTVSQYVNQYSQSEDYQNHLRWLFQAKTLHEHHVSIGLNCILRIQDLFFHTSASTSTEEPQHIDPQPGDAAKVRYVAGMCVGKVIYRNTQYVCRNIYKEDPQVHQRKSAVMVLRNHIVTSITIAKSETTYPDSLSEIIHKQTKYGHLTIVDDTLFRIFSAFDSLLQPHFTTRNLQDRKDGLFHSIIENTMDSLLEDSDVDIPCDITPPILYEVFRIYVRTCLNEMRIKVCDQLKVKKKLAHRKQVLLDEANPTPDAKRFKGAHSACNEEANPSTITEAQPEEPVVQETPSENICAICSKEYSSTSRFLWIECTSCKVWLHRKCDKSLKSQKKWKEVQAEGAKYSCATCRTVEVVLFLCNSCSHWISHEEHGWCIS